jgi:hypothetical protein
MGSNYLKNNMSFVKNDENIPNIPDFEKSGINHSQSNTKLDIGDEIKSTSYI